MDGEAEGGGWIWCADGNEVGQGVGGMGRRCRGEVGAEAVGNDGRRCQVMEDGAAE